MGDARLSSKQATRTPALQRLPQCGSPAGGASPCSEMLCFSGLCSSLFSVAFSLLQRQIQSLPDHAWPSSDDKPGLVVGRCVFCQDKIL